MLRCRYPGIPRNARPPPSCLPNTRFACSETTMISTTRTCMPKSRGRGRPRRKGGRDQWSPYSLPGKCNPRIRAYTSRVCRPRITKKHRLPWTSKAACPCSPCRATTTTPNSVARGGRNEPISHDEFFCRILSPTHIIAARSRRRRIETTQPNSDCFGYPQRATVCSFPELAHGLRELGEWMGAFLGYTILVPVHVVLIHILIPITPYPHLSPDMHFRLLRTSWTSG